ncbi:hypothetical protein F5I97DRAFT_1928014 [Phlebopus sp. FC_14]|nr:hypothetical protein F5I97DRAFT_1928014 [Phlebopus sp. FC_14]
MVKGNTPRKQRRKSLASRTRFTRLIREATALGADREPSASTSQLDQGPSCTKDKGRPTVNYANVLLIERFEAAVDNRTAICQRLEQLVRNSPIYTPAAQNRLICCLRDDFIRGDKTRRIIEDLRQSDFVSAIPGVDGNDFVRDEVSESTRLLLQGTRELQEIGDQIAMHFS